MKLVESLNLIHVCWWLESNGHEAIAKRLRDHIEDNDTYTKVYFDVEDPWGVFLDEPEHDDDGRVKCLTLEDVKFLRQTFGIQGKEVAFWVSM